MGERGNLMAGKRGIVFGVANNRSIAWGITKAVTEQGAEVALTYQGEALKKRVEPLAKRDRLEARAAMRRDRQGLRRCGVRRAQE